MLVVEPLRWALALKPEWLCFEQVPAVLPFWRYCADLLQGVGYSTWTGYLHAEQFGVPQTRKRAFLIASRVGAVAPPVPTHSKYYSRDKTRLDDGVQKWVSIAEALGWTDEGFLRSQYSLGGDTSKRGERLLIEPASTLTSKSGSMKWVFDRPATTVNCDPRISAPGRHDPNESGSQQKGGIRVTPAQAAILQSFPADFPWQGTKTKVFEQIGNAVPPGLARPVLEAAMTAGALEVAA
jgi:DNA (cytosine-5)-methyltransferase 1